MKGLDKAHSLPVHQVMDELSTALQHHQTVILEAPPGAGKSTWVPLYLWQSLFQEKGKIWILEPRRLATKSVAERMAWMIGEKPGQTVGYQIRFDKCLGVSTKIEVITEGILPARFIHDPTLDGVELLILDEFHERSLLTDEGLALALECRKYFRPELKILIMSATLDTGKLSEAFNHCPVIKSEGKMFPVSMIYQPPKADEHLIDFVTQSCINAWHLHKEPILCFVPGKAEVLGVKKKLDEKLFGVNLYGLYGEMPWNEQQSVIQDDAPNRIVISTSIAETSLTIPGIKTVVDSGFSRIPMMDYTRGMNKLETVRVSKDTADQRAGRAGRTAEGRCYRLWSRLTQEHLTPNRIPELIQSDLSSLILDLAVWDHADLETYFWIDPPPVNAVAQGLELLNSLKALNGHVASEVGRRLQGWPLHPRLAAMMEWAKGVGPEMISLSADVAALLENRDILDRKIHGADFYLRIEQFQKRRNAYPAIEKVAQQLRLMAGLKMYIPATLTQSHSCLQAAFPERIARKESESSYRLANGHKVHISPDDPLAKEEWIVAIHWMPMGKSNVLTMGVGMDPKDLKMSIRKEQQIDWDEREKRIRCEESFWIGMIKIENKPLLNPDVRAIRMAQLKAIGLEGMRIFSPDESFQQWQFRVKTCQRFLPDFEMPEVNDENLLASVDSWFPEGLSNIKQANDFAKCDWKLWIQQLLSWDQKQQLDKVCPPTIQVPSGSEIKLGYKSDGSSPILSVRLQEVFGWVETPKIALGRLPITMELLSPSFRPVQVTTDLRSFWERTYHEVKKELKGRYPKHSWPDDPFKAEAVRGAKKKLKS